MLSLPLTYGKSVTDVIRHATCHKLPRRITGQPHSGLAPIQTLSDDRSPLVMAPDDDQNTGKQMSIVAYDMLVTTPKGHTVR